MAFPYNTAGEPNLPKSSAPRATGGKQQPASARGPKVPRPQAPPKPRTVKVKGGKPHTRTLPPKAPPTIPQAPANADQALINAAVRSRFAPQETALNQQLQQNTRYSSGLPDWYANAQNEIRALQSQGQAQTQQTLGQLGQYNSQPTLQNPTDQLAANARNNLNSEFAAQQGQVGQANSGALDRLMAAFVLQQGNTQNQANRDRSQILGAKGQLGQQKADYALQYGAQLQTAEQKAASDALKNQIAADALGVKVNTLNQVQIPLAKSLSQSRTSAAATARANARTKRIQARNTAMNNDRQFNLDKKKFGLAQAKQNWQQAHPKGPTSSDKKAAADLKFFNQHGYYPPTGPPKTGAGAKPTQGQTKTTQSILDAKARYENGIAHGESLQSIANTGRQHNVSETVLQIASYLATHNGKPNASVRQKMKALGVDPSAIS